ncbi:hypothetical protein PSTG_19921 [Puccinia striiformis f. sp. tritici PST-78]|uniref:Uncharacterized protein n=1 Tax=Puccinia striiformis f. sp. tritici PST-78 TaxID=1165861 RepID=A0A0L0UIE2_9BASI|nr:hypothetical protein PSTG_19921 [Puccinia striiformis f. sp. tritici PST-78]
MGSCCRHDSVVFLANIHGTGDNRAHPLAILKRFLASVGEDRPVGVLYDLGCSLDNAAYGLNHVIESNLEPRSFMHTFTSGRARSSTIQGINKDGACPMVSRWSDSGLHYLH